jgi:hypothetical protein
MTFSRAPAECGTPFKTMIVCGNGIYIFSMAKRSVACSSKSHLSVIAVKASAHHTARANMPVG